MTQNNLFIPISILLAGAMVSFALMVSLGGPNTASTSAGPGAAVSYDIDINEEEFMSCLQNRTYQEKVAESTTEAQANGGNGTPFFILNGQPINGAQPFSVFEQAIQDALNEPAPENPDIETVTEGFPGLGDPNAPVVLVEYSDFSCGFCKRHNDQTKQQIIANYVDSGQVYYVRKDFISVGTSLSAEAAYCAGEQDAYWDMADILYANQSEDARTWNSPESYRKYVQ